MRELCERPGGKWASLHLSGKWGNAIGHAVFDGSLFLHDDETKWCDFFSVNFHRYCLA